MNFAELNYVLISSVGVGSIAALWIGRKILSWRTIVEPETVHVVMTANKATSYGKDTGNGNVYYEWPKWIPGLGVRKKSLSVANFTIPIDGYDAYDKDRVPFLVDIRTFFRIENTNRAAERITTENEMKDQIKEIVRGAVRNLLAKAKIAEIMEERSKYGEDFTNSIKEQLEEWGVVPVKNIELMDIRDVQQKTDPKTGIAEVGPIGRIMAMKQAEIEKESRMKVAVSNQEAREKEIEAERQVAIKEAEKEEHVGKRNAEKDQTVGIAEEKSKQKVAEEAKVTMEKNLAVEQVNQVTNAEITQKKAVIDAETTKKTTIIQAEQDKEKRIIDTGAEKEQIKIQTDAEKYNIETIADANLDAAKKGADAVIAAKTAEAKGVREVGTAAADAEKQMQLARVTAETTLAEKIGKIPEYQDYLVKIETVKQNANVEIKRAEFGATVGIEQAKALEKANVSVVANTGGSVQSGLKSVGDLFTPEFATKLGAADTALKNATGGTGLIDTVKEALDKFALAKGNLPNNARPQATK
ncbi:MAG: SPFH domain-containing protein [Alphaproteobacteria bacterium]|nr:SPFH domain-containing protein [Alphaproteobacteria bacterium]